MEIGYLMEPNFSESGYLVEPHVLKSSYLADPSFGKLLLFFGNVVICWDPIFVKMWLQYGDSCVVRGHRPETKPRHCQQEIYSKGLPETEQ